MFKNLVYFFILNLLTLLLSCKKSNSSKNNLSYIDLSNVKALVIPYDSSSVNKLSKNQILYKLTTSSSLAQVDFINIDGFNMNGYYQPLYFYSINDLYFLATFAISNSKPQIIESFIVNYISGKVFKLPVGFYPMKYNGSQWIQETIEKPIKEGPNNRFYFKGQDRIFEITQSALDLFNTEVINIIGTNASIFDVDLSGNIIVGNTIYASPTVSFKSTIITSNNTYVTASYSNGFIGIKLLNNNIIAFKTYFKNNQLVEDTISSIKNQGNNWQIIGDYKFTKPNQSVFVFNKGIICVKDTGASILKFPSISFSNIILSDQSYTHLFIYTIDTQNEKVLLQITPSNSPITYSEIFAPNLYSMEHINIFNNNNIVYQGNRLIDNSSLFGYYSSSPPYSNEVLNYNNLKASQLIAIK